VKHLSDNFTLILLTDVSRSLFAKDKTLFTVAAAFAILGHDGTVNATEMNALIYGLPLSASAASVPRPNGLDWVGDKAWGDLVAFASAVFDSGSSISTNSSSSSKPSAAATAAAMPRISSAAFLSSFSSNSSDWQTWASHAAPHTLALPGLPANAVTPFQKLIVVKVIGSASTRIFLH
jgi:hypothetical protein